MKTALWFPVLLMLPSLSLTHAGSATWNLNPTSGDWNTAANWTPATIPNSPTDIATFGVSNTTELSLSVSPTEVAAMVFNPGASAFNIAVPTAAVFSISGPGITNNSGVRQNLTIAPSVQCCSGTIEFVNAASAGDGTLLTVFGSATSGAFGGGIINFHDTATAGTATIVAEGALAGHEAHGGEVNFDGNATAGNASVTIDGALASGGFGGEANFFDFSSAGDAVFVINSASESNRGAGEMLFIDSATAANGIFTLTGSTKKFGDPASIHFNYGATAANGFFTVNGGQRPDTFSCTLTFFGSGFTGQIASAGKATIINNGGNGANSTGGYTSFFNPEATASQAVIVANGGENGGGGGTINFYAGADGGEARIELFGNGTLSITDLSNKVISVGSIEGDGLVRLGSNQLITGSNDLSTIFTGTIQDSGSLEKIGNGTLSLSGANTYTGGTTVSAGTLLLKNAAGSATGSGTVQVNGGTLGGKGIISGPTTLGSGSGTGGFLEPGKGASTASTLTIQNTLTFNSDGTYVWKLNTKKAKADKVVTNGVTIQAGAQFDFNTGGNKTLNPRTVFTAIRNTSAGPISGTFSNLADGSTFTVGRNNYQVNYSGGDGNDLTLTVVP